MEFHWINPTPGQGTPVLESVWPTQHELRVCVCFLLLLWFQHKMDSVCVCLLSLLWFCGFCLFHLFVLLMFGTFLFVCSFVFWEGGKKTWGWRAGRCVASVWEGNIYQTTLHEKILSNNICNFKKPKDSISSQNKVMIKLYVLQILQSFGFQRY